MTFKAPYYEALKFDKILDALLTEDNPQIRQSIAEGFHEVFICNPLIFSTR